ncbi:MAG: nucleotide exchange factor GrpE [Thermoplasmata archaeon]|nr:nucleotide exchange factor GrpE [Thermoplasmata archaeon]
MPVEKGGAEEPSTPPSATPEPTAAPDEKPSTPEAIEAWETRFKYLFADFENFRRRAARERESLTRTIRADVLLAMIPSYEAAQRAREAVSRLPPADPVRKGIDLLVREFLTLFDNEHVSPVARRGEPFRAEWHEAVAEAPPQPGVREGTVLEIIQQGYRIDTTLLRPAKVVVARAPSSTEPAAAAASESAAAPDASDTG